MREHRTEPFALAADDHEVLATAGLDAGSDGEAWLEATDTFADPRGGLLGISLAGATTEDLTPTFGHQSFDGRNDRCRVGDEEMVGPLHDRRHVAFARIAGAVGEPIWLG